MDLGILKYSFYSEICNEMEQVKTVLVTIAQCLVILILLQHVFIFLSTYYGNAFTL